MPLFFCLKSHGEYTYHLLLCLSSKIVKHDLVLIIARVHNGLQYKKYLCELFSFGLTNL